MCSIYDKKLHKVGEGIMTASFAFALYSMGLSLVAGISGTMLWGYYGGGLTDTGGDVA